MRRLTKDRAHVRVNRRGRLIDHVKNMNPQPGDQLRVGMDTGQCRNALRSAGWTVRCETIHHLVRRDDGKMVPVTLVTFL